MGWSSGVESQKPATTNAKTDRSSTKKPSGSMSAAVMPPAEAEVVARIAALREAEAAGQKLDARLSVARTLLSSASKRLGQTVEGAE